MTEARWHREYAVFALDGISAGAFFVSRTEALCKRRTSDGDTRNKNGNVTIKP